MQDDVNTAMYRKETINFPLRFCCDLSGSYVVHHCNINYAWKVWLYPEFFVRYILRLKIKYAYEYFRYAKQTPFANKIHKETSVKLMFKCIFELCFKPIEHFFRYQIRDKIKTYLYHFKSKKITCTSK